MARRKIVHKHQKLRALGIATILVLGSPVLIPALLIREFLRFSDAGKFMAIGGAGMMLLLIVGGITFNYWYWGLGVVLLAIFFIASAFVEGD